MAKIQHPMSVNYDQFPHDHYANIKTEEAIEKALAKELSAVAVFEDRAQALEATVQSNYKGVDANTPAVMLLNDLQAYRDKHPYLKTLSGMEIKGVFATSDNLKKVRKELVELWRKEIQKKFDKEVSKPTLLAVNLDPQGNVKPADDIPSISPETLEKIQETDRKNNQKRVKDQSPYILTSQEYKSLTDLKPQIDERIKKAKAEETSAKADAAWTRARVITNYLLDLQKKVSRALRNHIIQDPN